MSDWLSEDQARDLLFKAVHEAGTLDAFAELAGCARSLVSRSLQGQVPVGAKIGKYLGLIAAPTKVFRYLKTD